MTTTKIIALAASESTSGNARVTTKTRNEPRAVTTMQTEAHSILRWRSVNLKLEELFQSPDVFFATVYNPCEVGIKFCGQYG